MKLEVRFRGLQQSVPLRDYAARRVHFHLSRFGREINNVVIRISDINGPKGGVDKICRVTVVGPGVGTSIVEEYNGDAYAAVDAAIQRTGRTVGRRLEKVRSVRNLDHASWSAP